ncbi:hypothetical protein CN117_24945, partial [Sinorhizobium meliloti]
SVGAACPFSPPAGRRCRQADEGRVTANANVSAYGFDPKDPSASLSTAGKYRCRHSGVSPRRAGQQEICACRSCDEGLGRGLLRTPRPQGLTRRSVRLSRPPLLRSVDVFG